MVKVYDPSEFQAESFDSARSDASIVGEQVFIVVLPSRGRHGYPAKMRCRPLKVKDIKSLIEDPFEDETEYVRRLAKVVQGTILDAGINVLEMTMADFKKLLLAHRVNSLGSDIEIAYSCSCRDEMQVVRFDLMNLEEKEIAAEYEEPVRIGSLELRFPRLWGYLPEGKRSFDEVTDFDVLKSVVIGKEVEDLDLKEAKAAIEFVRKWEGSYGVQSEIEVPCKFCKKNVKVAIPYFSFFLKW